MPHNGKRTGEAFHDRMSKRLATTIETLLLYELVGADFRKDGRFENPMPIRADVAFGVLRRTADEHPNTQGKP